MAVAYLTNGNDDGHRLGLAASAKIGFYGQTPVTQIANIAALTASTATTTSCATAINDILTALKAVGIFASA